MGINQPWFTYLILIGVSLLTVIPLTWAESPPEHKPKQSTPPNPTDPLIITAEPALSNDHTRDTVVVDGDQLRQSPKSSVLESLSQENAGIYVTGRGALHGVANGATGGIYIRGLGGSPNSQVLVVEDGVPDFQGIFGHPIPDAYVPFLIEDVMVIKGGDSVIYGTNAMGGVVVIRNRWLDQPGYEMEQDFAYGSFHTLREQVSFLGKWGGLDIAAAFLGLKTDGHRTGAGGDELVGHTAVRYRFDSGWMVSLRNKVVHLTGADPGTVTHPNPDHWFDVWRDQVSLGLDWGMDRLHVSFIPHLNVGVHRLYDGFFSQDVVAGGIAELDWEFHPKWDLKIGLHGQHVGGNVENRLEQESENMEAMDDVAGYSQLVFHPTLFSSLVAGIRLMYSWTYGFVLLCKGGVKWNIYNGFFVKAAVIRNFRQPTLRELYLPFPTANPDLQPEYAFNADAGIGYESESINAQLTGYRTQADQLIKYFGFFPTAEVVNIDRLVVWGLEGFVQLPKLGPFSMHVSFDIRDVGRYTRQNPSLKMDCTLSFEKEIRNQYFMIHLGGEWVSGLYMGNYKRDPIADVVSLDATVRYRLSLVNRGMVLEPYLILRNLLNRPYAFVEYYPMPLFHILIGLKVQL